MPDGPLELGLLPTAVVEAESAVDHAAKAVGARNLAVIRTNARDMLRAVDPAALATDPKGDGRYGVRRASVGVVQFMTLAEKSDGASGVVAMHGSNVVIAANNTPRRVDEIVQIVGQIEEQTSTAGARPLAKELRALTEALLEGPEAGVEGSKDEHGLRQAEHHLMLLRKAKVSPWVSDK